MNGILVQPAPGKATTDLTASSDHSLHPLLSQEVKPMRSC